MLKGLFRNSKKKWSLPASVRARRGHGENGTLLRDGDPTNGHSPNNPRAPGNRWGRVLPHRTDPEQPQTSPDNPAGAHGVAILRRHFRLSKPPVFPLQILFFSLWHIIFF